MKLRGIEFGNVLGASGVQGFFGEGYWFHRVYRLLFGKSFGFDGVTLVSKTATLGPRTGNIKKGFLEKLFPSWAKVRFVSGHVLNAMGLPNPGIRELLIRSGWQKQTEPFMVSVASVAATQEERLEELLCMVKIVKSCRYGFLAPFALQINLSCPNTGNHPRELIDESAAALEIASELGVPLMPKYSIASAPIRAIMELGDNPCCDAICVSNTLPFGWHGIDWQKVWGSNSSPLAKFGGGGLSGRVLCPLVCEWIMRLRQEGFTKPINGGGGILRWDDVARYHDAGASSIFLGSMALLRPWRMRSIIKFANQLNWR